jgi:thiosulfate/3-mercaptopyruvate sulfurtransferase
MLVSTAWLAQHLTDPNLVLIEIGPKESYDAGHIPGAQFVDFHALMAPHQMDGKHEPQKLGAPVVLALELPSVARLDSALNAIGMTGNSRVVIYFSKEWVTPAARAYLTLDYAGLRGQVALLDGGLTTWQAEARPVTTEVPVARAGSFRSTPQNDVVVTADWVSSHLRDPKVQLIDARNTEYYTDSEDNGMPRGGHIAGAASIPFPTLVDSTSLRFKDRAELLRMFTAAGVRPGTTVVGYCHVGQQASLVYFAARYLGLDARLYDGSFQEWSAHPDWPIEGAHRSTANAQ